MAFNFSLGECYLLDQLLTKHNNMYDGRNNQRTVILVLYGALSLLGVIGNLFVIITIFTHRSLRNVRTSYIAHLACSDLMLCLLTAPVTLWLTVNKFWAFGNLACKMVACIQAFNTFVSVLNLTAIAWDRYLLIVYPVTWRSNTKALVCILFAIWFCSGSLAAPYFFATGAAKYVNGVWNSNFIKSYLEVCSFDRPEICIEMFPRSGFLSKRVYTISIVVCQYMLPLSGLLFVYANIARHSRSQGRTFSIANRNRLRNARRRQRKKTVLVTSLVITFGVCWLPCNLYFVLDALELVIFDQFLYIYFHLFGMTTACIHPVLYGLLNTNIRRSMAQTFRGSFRRQTPSEAESPDESRRHVGRKRSRTLGASIRRSPARSSRRSRSLRARPNNNFEMHTVRSETAVEREIVSEAR